MGTALTSLENEGCNKGAAKKRYRSVVQGKLEPRVFMLCISNEFAETVACRLDSLDGLFSERFSGRGLARQ